MAESNQENVAQKAFEVESNATAESLAAANRGGMDALSKNKNLILAGLVAVVLLIGGIIWYGSYKDELALEAENAAANTFRMFDQDSMRLVLQDDAGRPSVVTLADKYSGTPTGKIARYMAGVAYLDQGNFAKAIEYLDGFSTGDDMITAAAAAALAAAYEGTGDFAKAGREYERAAETNANSQTSPFFLLEAGRCYEQANDNDQALKVYKRLHKQYPTSGENQEAEKHIFRLGGTL
jgi:tetratricopeptide (TPR) repeat protein